jgi:hypothetical protein
MKLSRPMAASLALLLSACTCPCMQHHAPETKSHRPPHLFRYEYSSLERLRTLYNNHDPAAMPIVDALLANADKALNDKPYSVVYKKHTLPGVTDPHEYVSLAPYYWPNPDTPNHLPYIAKDGQRNPEFKDYDADNLMMLTDHVDAFVLAWFITGDQKYADRTALLIKTWFLNPETRMNPNLDHCQSQPGINDAFHSGIIESRRFIDMIDATCLLRGNSAWTQADNEAFKQWIGEYNHWMKTAKVPLEEDAAPNNHGTWYDVQIASYDVYTGNFESAKKILETAKEKRIGSQIKADGTQPEELKRTKAFWYSEFNLNALAQLCNIGRHPAVQVDLWNYESPKGGSMKKAIDWLIPYAAGEKEWTYQQIEGLSAKEFLVPVRQAELVWNTTQYEPQLAKLRGQDVKTDDDTEHPLRPKGLQNLLYPPPQ